MSEKRIALGKIGEQLAAKYLRQKGFQILEQNIRLYKAELDIVAREQATLVFVEVKTRKNDHFGSPAEAVTYRKQQQISKAALAYIAKNNLDTMRVRFDVIGILLPKNGSAEIEHIRDAFESAWNY